MSRAKTMRALQLCGPGQLKEARVPVPKPGPGEVLIRTDATTICTSDLNDIAHNPFGIVCPRVLGHEGAGVIEAAGDDAPFSRGDHVAAHPVIPCGVCENCQRGLGHLCSRMGHLGLDRDGTFAEFFCVRADRVRRVPADVAPFACLLEPVAVCLEAVRRGGVKAGDGVLVAGDGPFGIIIARLAARLRPRRIVLAGRHEFRLRQAPQAVAVDENRTPDMLKAVLEANAGAGFDVAIMAAGTQSALDLCLGCLRARGRAVVFSAIPGRASLDLFRLHTHELEIAGACNDQDLIDPALECLQDCELDLTSLITHRIAFDQWQSAFDLARNGKDEALKVALMF